MKTKLLLFVLLTALFAKATPPTDEGKTIFTTRCAGCHNVNKILTGPALAGVDQRHTLDWIVNFVHSSQTVIKKGDPAAVALFNKFNHIQMPDHPDLSADNIKNVVEYIKIEANAGAAKLPAKKDVHSFDYKKFTGANNQYLVVYAGLLALLFASVLFAYKVKLYKQKVFAGR